MCESKQLREIGRQWSTIQHDRCPGVQYCSMTTPTHRHWGGKHTQQHGMKTTNGEREQNHFHSGVSHWLRRLFCPVDHGHEKQSIDPCLPLMDKLLKPQLLCDLRTDLEQWGQEAHEVPKAAGIRAFLCVLHQFNVLPPAILPYHLTVSQTTGSWSEEEEEEEGEEICEKQC